MRVKIKFNSWRWISAGKWKRKDTENSLWCRFNARGELHYDYFSNLLAILALLETVSALRTVSEGVFFKVIRTKRTKKVSFVKIDEQFITYNGGVVEKAQFYYATTHRLRHISLKKKSRKINSSFILKAFNSTDIRKI